MTLTATLPDLLVVALQDLHAGAQQWTARLPRLWQHAPPELHTYLTEEQARSGNKCTRLAKMLETLEAEPIGMPNIWLTAVLDDAGRDAETIREGPLRGIALVGAFRKGKQSERVSYETAIGLARAAGHAEIAETLVAIRDREQHADTTLETLLEALLRVAA